MAGTLRGARPPLEMRPPSAHPRPWAASERGMKALGGILAYLTGSLRGRNLRVVAWLVATLVLLVAIYSGVFHVLMEREGRSHSIATGVYWTLTTMSTLDFGDITFNNDPDRKSGGKGKGDSARFDLGGRR